MFPKTMRRDNGKYLSPTNDYAFQRIFGTEKNKHILVSFLNDVLLKPHPIESVTFLPTVQNPNVAARKQSIVDVLCQDDSGDQYIVEMQVAHSEWFIKRAQYYAAHAYSKQLYPGDDYAKLRPVIFVAITDFVMFKNKPSYKSDHVILDKKSHEQDLHDFSFTFLELPKFHKQLDELENSLEIWMYFFKYAARVAPQEWEQLSKDSAIIRQAFEELDQFYWTEAEINTYERELKNERDAHAIITSAVNRGTQKGFERGEKRGFKRGFEKGIEKAIEQGLKKAKLETAANMLSLGLDVKVVVAATGLSPDEVEELHLSTLPPNANL